MPTDESRISHVSDTALMTAACRAIETSRPDGLVQDPFAARMAGDRGMAIAQSLPRLDIMCFGIGMRTRLLDELLLTTLSNHNIATVMSVGAGLDTRPWRLSLPPHLRWIEVDLPAMLEYKSSILDSEKPSCHIERMVVDVNDPERRSNMFASVSEPALMITEGLLMYLPAPTVNALAAEAMAAQPLKLWILDLASGELARAVRMNSFQDIEAVRAPDNLDGEQIQDAVKQAGWVSLDRRTYAANAMKIIPPARLAQMVQARAAAGGDELPPPPPPTDWSGVHLFGRS